MTQQAKATAIEADQSKRIFVAEDIVIRVATLATRERRSLRQQIEMLLIEALDDRSKRK